VEPSKAQFSQHHAPVVQKCDLGVGEWYFIGIMAAKEHGLAKAQIFSDMKCTADRNKARGE
jgi:hypothetical protein